MPSPVSTPLPTVATGATITDANEHVAVVTSGVYTDAIRPNVYLDASGDLLNSSSGTTLTVRIRRGNGITGTVVATYGPFTLTASARSNWSINGLDTPPESFGLVYSVTLQLASNAGTATVESALVDVMVQPNS